MSRIATHNNTRNGSVAPFPCAVAANLRDQYTRDLASYMQDCLVDFQYPTDPALRTQVLAAEDAALLRCDTSMHCLFAIHAPGVNLDVYVDRLVKYMRCSPECFLIATRYLARLGTAGVPVTPRTIHRLFFACVVIATKMRDDKYYAISFYASVGGVVPADLRAMERAVFALLGYDASCGAAEYAAQLQTVRVHSAALEQGGDATTSPLTLTAAMNAQPALAPHSHSNRSSSPMTMSPAAPALRIPAAPALGRMHAVASEAALSDLLASSTCGVSVANTPQSLSADSTPFVSMSLRVWEGLLPSVTAAEC